MKNMIFLIWLSLSILGCSRESINAISSLNGTVFLDTIEIASSNPWLKDFDLNEWGLLELTLQHQSDSSISMTTKNSPDKNVFPASSQWIFQRQIENTQIFKGEIEGFALEGANFRYYYVFHDEQNMIILVVIQPDCPKDTACTLEGCCDILFKFKKSSVKTDL